MNTGRFLNGFKSTLQTVILISVVTPHYISSEKKSLSPFLHWKKSSPPTDNPGPYPVNFGRSLICAKFICAGGGCYDEGAELFERKKRGENTFSPKCTRGDKENFAETNKGRYFFGVFPKYPKNYYKKRGESTFSRSRKDKDFSDQKGGGQGLFWNSP